MVLTKQNSISRKLIIIFLAFLLYATSLLGSYNKSASAAVPAALAVAGGAGYSAVAMYVMGALVVSAGAAVVGLDYADDIKTHATTVWNGLNETSQKAWKDTIEASIVAGKSTMTLTNSMFSDLLSLKDKIVEGAQTIIGAYELDRIGVSINDELMGSSSSYRYINYDPFYGTLNEDVMVIFNGYKAGSIQIKHDYVYTGFVTVGASEFPDDFQFPITEEQWSALRSATNLVQLRGAMASAGIPFPAVVPNDSPIPSKDYFDNALDQAINNIGVKEVNIPLDQFLARDVAGNRVDYNESTGVWAYPDGVPYTGDVSWDVPVAVPNTGVAVPTVGSPAVPITDIVVGDIPVVGTGTVTVPPPPTGGGGGNPLTDLVPVAFLMAFLDLLRAILMYLGRMFTFITTIPLIQPVSIDNVAFEWFKSAKIVGVHIYNVISSLASIGLSFMIYRSIRRLLP